MLGKGGNFAHLFCCERNSAVKAETSKCRGREFRVVSFFACLKIPEYRTGSFFWQSACLSASTRSQTVARKKTFAISFYRL